jgi:hypothetical protein
MQAYATKCVRLKSAFGVATFSEYIKDDFITVENPDIEIMSALDSERERSKERISYSSIYPMIANDPTKPLISKKFAERKLLELDGRTDEEINILCPPTADEMRATEENELLAKDQKVEIKVETEDHLSHIVVHTECPQTATRDTHIRSHRDAYIESGQAQRDKNLFNQLQANGAGGNGAVQNAMTNTLVSQANSSGMNPMSGSVSPNQ